MSSPTNSPSGAPSPAGKSAKKRTRGKKETGTENEVKQQHTTDTQQNLARRMKGGGQDFETQIAALIGLRGLKRGENFELFFNRNDVGNFDDLVYTAGGRRYFLQLKHADSPDNKQLATEDMVTLLQICFKSYCNIKNGNKFTDIPVDKTEFIIYTNRKLDPKLSQQTRKQTKGDIIFKTSDKEIFIFVPDNNKETDLFTLLENAVKGNKEIHGSTDREMISEFFNRVIMVASVDDKCQLDDEILKEIEERDALKVDCETYKAEILYLKRQVETWLKNRREVMTAEMFRNWLQEAITEACRVFVSNLFVGCTQRLVTKGTNFADSEISRLKPELSDKRLVQLRTNARALYSTLLMDCLDTSKCIFVNLESLQSNKSMLLHAWLGGDWQWCIMFCVSRYLEVHVSDEFLNLFRMKPLALNKRLIILTPRSVEQIQDFSPIARRFKFQHLSKESQKMVLEKKVQFQGHKLTLKSILEEHGILKRALRNLGPFGADVVLRLVTDEAVQLGSTLHTNRGHYSPRVLERKDKLQLDVLRNPDSHSDVFIVSGIKVKDLAAIVPKGENVQYIDQQNVRHIDFTKGTRSRFIVLSEADAEICFLELCKKSKGRTLHWVQFNNGTLQWKKTHGKHDKLLRETREVSEDLIWDSGERTVLVVAEPGMGKSSTTTQVALNTKLAHPAWWVVRINWNDHIGKLQRINTKTFNLNSLVKFLCSASFPESKYTGIELILFKQALQNSGNVTVLMDGFDEICPTHADKATVILSELMKTKVRRIWVTSRPVQKERLEKELSVKAFSMKKLSHQS